MRLVGRPRPSFRPLLYLMIFGAAVRMACTNFPILPIDTIFAHGTYAVWIFIALTSPPLSLVAWWLVHCKPGAWRYRGLWFRLASDVGCLTVVLAYHVTTVMVNPMTELRMMSRYIVGATMLHLLGLVVVDVVALIRTERIARG